MYRLACLLLVTAAVLPAGDANEDLLDAARKGNLQTVKTLVESGASIEAKLPTGRRRSIWRL